MKLFLIAAALILTLTRAHAAEDTKLDCTAWEGWQNEQKTQYLAGYNDAVGLLGLGGAVGGESAEGVQKVIFALWPQGYNLGKLADDLDKVCLTEPFKKMRLNFVILGLAGRVQRENTK